MQTGAESSSVGTIEEENTKETTEISATASAREMTDRREFGFRTIFSGLLRPRRRYPRRGEDGHSYHADYFDRELMFPAVGTVLLSGQCSVRVSV